MRVLRPLRVINKNEGLKMSMNALMVNKTKFFYFLQASVIALFNIVFVSLLFFLIFGSIGVNYFKGRYYSCEKYFLNSAFESLLLRMSSKWDCINSGGIWINYIYDFDNIGNAILSLFIVSTTAGWADLMYRAAAITDIDINPIPKTNIYYTLFFVLFIIIGSFFMLNLFVGVIISSFNDQKLSYGKNFLLTKK